MTAKREKAFRNAIASARMEGLPFSKKSEQDCLRYLDGHLDAATLVREVLRQPQDTLYDRPIFCRLLSLYFRPYQ